MSKSETMCRNRNLRRLAFGYKDIYSSRDRGWPTDKATRKFYRDKKRAKLIDLIPPGT